MCIFISIGAFRFQFQIGDGDDVFRFLVSCVLWQRFWDFDIHYNKKWGRVSTNFDFGRDISHYYVSTCK